MKIAVFLYYFPSRKRVYISSLCNMLAKLEHEVHIFSFFVNDPYWPIQGELHNNIKISDIGSDPFSQYDYKPNIIKVFAKYIKIIIYILCDHFPVIKKKLTIYIEYSKKRKLDNDMQNINKILKNLDTFDCSIGIEKGGIICSYQLYKLFKVPFYYFSLELYDENHPTVIRPTMEKAMRTMEITAHHKASGTIIADKDRKESLYKTGNIDTCQPAFYLPISFDEVDITRNNPLPTNIVHSRKIIINFGHNRITNNFFLSLLDKLPEDYLFLTHNNMSDNDSKNISSTKFHYSTKLLNEEEIMAMIADSFVGLCWYNDKLVNDRLIAFSSEKTARYLSAGKPIIANKKTNFVDLFSNYKCGIAVDTPDEFIKALEVISSNYQEFSHCAREAFDKIYKLSNYQQSLNSFLVNNLQ